MAAVLGSIAKVFLPKKIAPALCGALSLGYPQQAPA